MNDLRAIVADLAALYPARYIHGADEKECALCGDWMTSHTDKACPWLRALAVVLNGEPDLIDVIEAKLGPVTGGQVLVLRGVTFEDGGESLLTALIDCARERGLTGNAAEHVPLVVCLADDSASIEHLDEDEMRAAGWVRA